MSVLLFPFFQIWKRLSSLQRTIILLVLLAGGVSAVYIIPNLRHADSAEMIPTNRNKFRHAELVGGNKIAEMEMDKQNVIDDLKKHAQQEIDKIMVGIVHVRPSWVQSVKP